VVVIGMYAWLLRSRRAPLIVFVASFVGSVLGFLVQEWLDYGSVVSDLTSPFSWILFLILFTVYFGWWLLILTAVVTRTSKERNDALLSVWLSPALRALHLSALGGQTSTGALRVTPTSMTTTAQATVLPLIALTNISHDNARWSATTTQFGLAISPQSGALYPGQSQRVTVITGGKLESVCDAPGKPEFTILFNGASQPLTVTVTVTCP
jgi:hypothetical protein